MGNPWIDHIKKVKASNVKLFEKGGLKAIILLAKESYKSVAPKKGKSVTKGKKSKGKKSRKSKKGKKGKKGTRKN
jgi:hypothetical protein